MTDIYKEFKFTAETTYWPNTTVSAADAITTAKSDVGWIGKNTRAINVTLTMKKGAGPYYVPDTTTPGYIMNYEYDSTANQTYFSSGTTAYNVPDFDQSWSNYATEWNGTTTGYDDVSNALVGSGTAAFCLIGGNPTPSGASCWDTWNHMLRGCRFGLVGSGGLERFDGTAIDKSDLLCQYICTDSAFGGITPTPFIMKTSNHSSGGGVKSFGLNSYVNNEHGCYGARVVTTGEEWTPIKFEFVTSDVTLIDPIPYGPNCMDQDTKVLCLTKDLKEEQIAVKDLRPGDIVKTYKQGYRRINQIAHQPGFNNTTSERKTNARYVLRKTEENGLTEDLYLSAKHLVLVDKLTPEQEKNEKETFGKTFNVMDKALVQARHHPDFEMVEEPGYYLYYQMTLENDGDVHQRHGIWTNGYLTETTCEHDFETHLADMTRVK